MSKYKLSKNSLSMNFNNYNRHPEAFEEKVNQIAPNKVKSITELLSVQTFKRNFIFSKKIFKLKKKSESVDLVKHTNYRIKEEAIDSQIKSYDENYKKNLKEFLKLREENDNFEKNYNSLKKLNSKKSISCVVKGNPDLAFSDLLNAYEKKGYNIPDLAISKNIFTSSPLLLINKNISSNPKNFEINSEKDERHKGNLKSLKYIEKLYKGILEKENLNNKNSDKVVKRIAFLLKRFPTINIKNQNYTTEGGGASEIEIEEIKKEIAQMREVEYNLNQKKSIRLKKEKIKTLNIQQKNSSLLNKLESFSGNINQSMKSIKSMKTLHQKSSITNKLNKSSSQMLIKLNQKFSIPIENFSEYNSKLNSDRKTCADSESISNFGISVSKFEIGKISKQISLAANSEYLNYALNSLNLDMRKKESRTSSRFYSVNKKELKANDIYRKIEKHQYDDDGLDENYEDMTNYFKDKNKKIDLNHKIIKKDILDNISEVKEKINEFNIIEKFNRTFVNGHNFRINLNKIDDNNILDKKIKKLDKGLIRKISLWNNIDKK